ncbi:MAG: twin transmembrane helix small protein [Betaproteobacteria bacterium]
MKTLVVVMLLLVVGSLFSALYFMYRDKGNSKRMVTALTFRIALSVSIFLILTGSYYFGLIPHK